MSRRLNWVDKGDGIISPAPMTATTMAALLRNAAPAGKADRIKVINERRIEVDGDWGHVVLEGKDPA